MKTAQEFITIVDEIRQKMQKEIYTHKKKVLEETLDSSRSKGSYIQYGYVEVDNEQIKAGVESIVEMYNKNYQLGDGACKKIHGLADEQIKEKFLKPHGWGLNKEGHLIPLVADAEKEKAEE